MTTAMSPMAMVSLDTRISNLLVMDLPTTTRDRVDPAWQRMQRDMDVIVHLRQIATSATGGYLTSLGMYERYGPCIERRHAMGRTGMVTNEFLAQIKADREREIRATQRAQMVRRRSADDEPEHPTGLLERASRLIGRPVAQAGRTRPDPTP